LAGFETCKEVESKISSAKKITALEENLPCITLVVKNTVGREVKGKSEKKNSDTLEGGKAHGAEREG